MILSAYGLEYFFIKNKYFEIYYEDNKNNIIVNYYYDEKKNIEYSLVPVFSIIFFEGVILESLPFFS